MKTTRVLFLFAFFVVCSGGAVQAAWIVELTSGQTIEANSYRVEKGRVLLQYPVGEASIMLSQVKSILRDDKGVPFFQQKGVEAAHETPAPTGPAVSGAANKQQAAETRPEKAGAPAPPPPENPVTASESPTAKSPPAANGQFELKPKFNSENLSQLLSQSVEVKTPPQNTVFNPEVEDIINSLQNADETQRTEIEKRMNKLFETATQ